MDADHPRVCGEQPACSRGTVLAAGSPPRVRGTVLLDEFKKEIARITPACAGNRAREKEDKDG